jgi:imidazolonepropionase-like amidohydrolase
MEISITLRLLSGKELTLGVDGPSYTTANADDHTVDLRRYWAVPGLVDAHGHLIANNTPDMLATDAHVADIDTMRSFATAQLDGGVLLMVDKGSKTDATLALLDFPENERPALEMAGRIFAPEGGYFPHFPVSVSDAELERTVTRACETTPAQWIKIVGDWPRRGIGPVPNYTEDALAAAVAVAHGHGRRVAIHTMAPDVPSMAVRAGIDSIEHGLFLTVEDIQVLGQRRGMWVPTIAAMEGIVDQLGESSSGGRLIRRGLGNVAEILPGAREAGVHVLGGTDIVLAHGAVAQEGPRLVEYGLSDADAVDVLTAAGYRALGRSIFAPGASADLALFHRNPLADVTELQRPVAVLRCGEWRFAPEVIGDAFGAARHQ